MNEKHTSSRFVFTIFHLNKLFSLFLILLSANIFLTQLNAQCPADYPDNTDDIPWTDTGGEEDPYQCPPNTVATFNGIVDIAAAFSNARALENSQISTSLPSMTSSQLAASDDLWNAKSDAEKALVLMNLERAARSIPPFQEVDANVQNVAQSYADYLRINDQFSHSLNCGDASPCNAIVRMDQNAVINGHQQFSCRFENLAAFYAPSMSCAPLPIERAIYGWIYQDVTQSNGHRKACLYNISATTDDFGTAGAEGQIGIGVSTGPYDGWDYGVVIVFNFFDPNNTYNPAAPLQITTFLEGTYNTTSGNMQNTLTGNIPLTSPFSADTKTVNVIPANVVDWILVELRDKTNSSNIIVSKSAFVLSNGNIVDTDGVSPLKFPGTGDNYFVSVKHRNHLGIMSETVLSLSTN